MTKKYYAREWWYGKGCTTGKDYHDACDYYRFDNKNERDAWVEDGRPYYHEAGYRDACPANDKFLKRLLYIPTYSDGEIYTDEHNQIFNLYK